MTVADKIRAHRNELTRTERRVAEAVLASPQAVAFGTVAEVAALSGTSGGSVARLAVKLGYDGFAGLRDGVQTDLAARLKPAAQRIRQPSSGDTLGQVFAREIENLETTLQAVDRKDYWQAVKWLADQHRRVLLCPADSYLGIGMSLADQLASLRPDVALINGNQVRVGRDIAAVRRGDVLVAIDFHRYDRWALRTAELSRDRGARVVALTDSPMGGLAAHADLVFPITLAAVGPFDSQVGALVLGNALVTGVAAALRSDASVRLDLVEQTWHDMDALSEP